MFHYGGTRRPSEKSSLHNLLVCAWGLCTPSPNFSAEYSCNPAKTTLHWVSYSSSMWSADLYSLVLGANETKEVRHHARLVHRHAVPGVLLIGWYSVTWPLPTNCYWWKYTEVNGWRNGKRMPNISKTMCKFILYVCYVKAAVIWDSRKTYCWNLHFLFKSSIGLLDPKYSIDS